jgi:flagellar biosynthesis protein FliQ
MNPDTVTSLGMQALTMTIEVSMPFLLAGLVVGLTVSIFQAVTSIQEPTLTFIPKIIATGAVLALAGPWMLDQMLAYVTNLYTSIPGLVGP